MSVGVVALFLLAVGLIAVGIAFRPRDADARAAAASRELDEAIARAGDLVATARNLGRELEDTGMAVAQQAGEHLRALKSAVADADKHLKAMRAAEPPPVKSRPIVAPEPQQAARPGARLDVTVEDGGVRPIAASGPGSDRHAAIYGLADQGRTVEEIAQALDMGKGEVQLILSLRRPV